VGTHGGKAPLENAGTEGDRKAPYSAAEAPAGANVHSHTGFIRLVLIVAHHLPYGDLP
jgi:hypothetical protein